MGDVCDTNAELRRCLRSIYDVCEECDRAGVSASFMGHEFSVRQLFEIEVTAYLMYLTAADGVVNQEEIDFINDVMSRDYELDACVAFATQHRLTGAEFASSTPLSFRLLIEHAPEQGDGQASMSDVLISFYMSLSAALATSDADVAPDEQTAVKSYLHLLRGYQALVEGEGAEGQLP